MRWCFRLLNWVRYLFPTPSPRRCLPYLSPTNRVFGHIYSHVTWYAAAGYVCSFFSILMLSLWIQLYCHCFYDSLSIAGRQAEQQCTSILYQFIFIPSLRCICVHHKNCPLSVPQVKAVLMMGTLEHLRFYVLNFSRILHVLGGWTPKNGSAFASWNGGKEVKFAQPWVGINSHTELDLSSE